MSSLPKIGATGIVFVLTWSVGLAPGFAADAVSRAELLASMCNTCHGTNGKGAKPIPGIGGEEPEEFVDLMQAFANGEEAASIMGRHAQGYTEAELKLLAEYFSKQ
jgi:cytochrome c553